MRRLDLLEEIVKRARVVETIYWDYDSSMKDEVILLMLKLDELDDFPGKSAKQDLIDDILDRAWESNNENREKRC